MPLRVLRGLFSQTFMLQNNRLYNDLAWMWPIISPPEEYEEESGEFIAHLREHAQREVRTLLNLGCGGGHNDFWFKHAFSVTGVDVSDTMLALARQLNPEVRYLSGDMRAVRLGETFDAIIIADAIDYMLTEDDLRAAFTTAYAHLNPGGLLCTYAEETRERFEQNKIRYTERKHGPIEITTLENSYDPNPDDTTFDLTFIYLIRQNSALTIETDRHLSGLFDMPTWIGLLEEVGFTVKVTEYEEAGPLFVGVKE